VETNYTVPRGISKARDRSGWSEQQIESLSIVESWLSDERAEPFFYLAGYAGTGKTTLASEIAERRGGDVVFGALTGKAAAVMQSKGCAGAATIDSLIYRACIEFSCARRPACESPPCRERCRYSRERFNGRELNKDSAVADASLVIIDEVSMVGPEMGRDLLSFRTPLLVLGDKAQLPPIGDGGYFTEREPDFQLTEVHRQALGSPVIELATRVRKQQPLRYGDFGDSAVVDGISIKEMLNFDQIICGTHRTRHSLNKKMRRALGFDGITPERGEKVICLRNHRRKDLRNGTLWTVVETAGCDDGFIEMVVENEAGLPVEVVAPEAGFTSYDGAGSDLPGQPFAFGYAITCHKAQGSQWGSVLIIDESAVFREHRWRWLYTAITRAVDRVVVSW
jgi:exodeoxyribonuclease-5